MPCQIFSPEFISTHIFSVIHSVMRGYQLQDLNWMVLLYHNMLSGILADPMLMGLGKPLTSHCHPQITSKTGRTMSHDGMVSIE
jgi:hypothetical protein